MAEVSGTALTMSVLVVLRHHRRQRPAPIMQLARHPMRLHMQEVMHLRDLRLPSILNLYLARHLPRPQPLLPPLVGSSLVFGRYTHSNQPNPVNLVSKRVILSRLWIAGTRIGGGASSKVALVFSLSIMLYVDSIFFQMLLSQSLLLGSHAGTHSR